MVGKKKLLSFVNTSLAIAIMASACLFTTACGGDKSTSENTGSEMNSSEITESETTESEMIESETVESETAESEIPEASTELLSVAQEDAPDTNMEEALAEAAADAVQKSGSETDAGDTIIEPVFQERPEAEEIDENTNWSKEPNKAIMKILDEITSFRYQALVELRTSDNFINIGDSAEYDLNSKNVTRAAGMCKSVNTGADVDLSEAQSGKFLEVKDMQAACRDIFGQKLDLSTLDDSTHEYLDTILYEGKPLRVFCNYDNDLDDIVLNTTIKKEGNQYIAIQDIFQGYWGYSCYNKPNYKITYTFRNDKKSKYKLVLTGLSAELTDNEYTW